MALNFGSLEKSSKNICFNVPEIKVDLSGLKNIISAPKLSGLKLPNVFSSALNFGTQLKKNLQNIKLPKIKGGKFGLNFGGFGGIEDKLKNLSVPTTFCLSLGGGLGLDSLFDQLGSLLDALPKPLSGIQLPEIPQLDLASIIPPILIDVKLPLNINLSQTLDIIKNNCVNSILDAIKGLDPFERLTRLLEMAAQLCAAADFTKLKAVIEQIQQAKIELIQQALSYITDPIAKIAALIDMAVDAFQNGAYDLVEEIARIINGVKFDALMNFIDKLDPTVAIAALIANIKQLAQLRNFGPINELMSAIQIMKAKLIGIVKLPELALEIPELALDALQAMIDKLLNLDDFLGIQSVLAQIQKLKDAIINNLKLLNPSELLAFIPALLQEALSKLDLSQYNQILQEAGSKLCADMASLIPQVS